MARNYLCTKQPHPHYSNYYYFYDSQSNSTSECNIIHMYLIDMNLNGTIPRSLGNLQQLINLHLSRNFLFGSIPPFFESIPLLEILDLGSNRLTGTIPIEVGNLSNLRILNLPHNHLNGTIPSLVGWLSSLGYLWLYSNQLTGTIPSSIGSLSNLQDLSLDRNQLTGSIPSFLGSLLKLQFLGLYSNQLTNSIPSSLGSLSKLIFLILNSNQLTGTIPSSFESLSKLQYLELNSNRLTSSIPSFLGSLSRLGFIYLDSNQLTSSIPSSFGSLSKLQILYLDSNRLTGTIPSSLGSFSNLLNLILDSNQLTSSIPSTFGSLSNLRYLWLYSNQLTGLIPSSLDSLSNIRNLYLSQNRLHGPLPDLSSCMELTDFQVFGNSLTGTIPAHYSQLPLKNVFLNDNSISGTLDRDLFNMSSIEVISLSSNCFRGFLPESYSPSIRTLYMSDLSSGVGCRIHPLGWLKSGISSGFYPLRYISGDVPSSLFELPSLTALYLSGNGLTGSLSLPSAWDCRSGNLRTLALSANQLSGSIPVEIQECGLFDWLDLSYNRFSGSLVRDFKIPVQTNVSQGSYFSLCVNRLSGPLPWSSNLSTLHGSIIGDLMVGNMFSFSYSEVSESMGSQDASVLRSYSGSFVLNTVLYVYVSVCMVCVLHGLVYRYHLAFRSIRLRFELYTSISISTFESPDVGYDLLLKLRRVGYVVSLISLSVLSVCLLILKNAPSLSSLKTQEYQYTWMLSACYLHGWLPISLIVLILWLSLSLVLGNLPISVRFPQTLVISLAQFDKIRQLMPNWKVVLLMMVNMCVVMAVNGVYLLLLLNQGNDVLIQLLVGLFKGGWNVLMFVVASPLLGSLRSRYWYYMLILTFNMIVAPCLTTLLTESACLFPLFAPISIPSSSITVYGCIEFDLFSQTCLVSGNIGTQFSDLTSPFIYSYQCASALIVDFVPVLLYSTIFSGICWPLLQMYIVLMNEMNYIPDIYRLSLSQWFPLLVIVDEVKPAPELFQVEFVSSLVHSLVNLLIFLTFGLACPYLGIGMIFISRLRLDLLMFLTQRYQFRSSAEHRLKLKELNRSSLSCLSELELSLLSKHSDMLANIVSESNPSTDSAPVSSSFDLDSAVSCTFIYFSLLVGLFWSFQAFDMVGDVYGSKKGTLATVLMCVLTILVCVVLLLLKQGDSPRGRGQDQRIPSYDDQKSPLESVS